MGFRRSITVLALACVGTTVGILGSVGSAGAESSGNKDGATVQMEFGKPDRLYRLHYIKFYDKKPFIDTDLYLYSNGAYWLTSAGEDHYGVYVVTDHTDKNFTVRFISLPSSDWGEGTAYHELAFTPGADENSGTFTQVAYAASDPDIPYEHGTYTSSPTTIYPPTKK